MTKTLSSWLAIYHLIKTYIISDLPEPVGDNKIARFLRMLSHIALN